MGREVDMMWTELEDSTKAISVSLLFSISSHVMKFSKLRAFALELVIGYKILYHPSFPTTVLRSYCHVSIYWLCVHAWGVGVDSNILSSCTGYLDIDDGAKHLFFYFKGMCVYIGRCLCSLLTSNIITMSWCGLTEVRKWHRFKSTHRNSIIQVLVALRPWDF